MKNFNEISNDRAGFSVEHINPVIEQFVFPASFSQQGLWLVDKLTATSANYIIPCGFRLNGKLDVEALELALNAIIKRHEVLRTCFTEQDGVPVQLIHSSLSISLTLVDLRGHSDQQRTSEVASFMKQNDTTAFDLKKLPLLRFQLLQIKEEEYIFLLAFHHIISDGWSMEVFFRELSSFYGAYSQGMESSLPELPIQFADYAVWQRECLQGEIMAKLVDYWHGKLADVSTLNLPNDRSRPAIQSYRGKIQSFRLSLDLTEELKLLSKREGVTLFMTLLAAFQVLLHRYSGQDDIIVGSPNAGRSRLELEGLIGFFVNTLVLRTDLSGDPTFHELLLRVREVAIGAYANQDMPFVKLVEGVSLKRDRSRNPLFQVMFILQNTFDEKLQLNEVTAKSLPLNTGTTKFDLTLELSDTSNGLAGKVEYAADLFEESTIEHLIGHFQTLLHGITFNPEKRVSQLPLLTESERQQIVVDWNDTTVPIPNGRLIHHLFEDQVALSPMAVAVVYENQQLTYQQLNAHANQLAHYLRSLGVGPEVMVAICLQRSLDMVVGLLAILKAGGAYVPLDPVYPKYRLVIMLEDSAPLVLLTQGRYKTLFTEIPKCPRMIDVSVESYLWEKQPSTNPSHSVVGLRSENLAYVIYTSGSTGKPKGAGVLHRGLQNLLPWYIGEAHITSDDAVLLVTSMAFDLTQRVTYGPLLAGARLVLANEPFDPKAIVAQVVKEGISMMNLTPSGFNTLIDVSLNGELSGLRKVFLGGEPMQLSKLLELPEPRPEFVNNYGPTECTATATYYRLSPDLEQYCNRSVPIGRPIFNARIYILDNNKQVVPIGVMGEIYIGGVPVGRGYLNQPELTAERFVLDPFTTVKGSRMYKSGDLARYLVDGNIEFLGRIDHQVKIRGFRIELGEIESLLEQHQKLREVVVSVYEPILGDKRLVAYMVSEKDSTPSVTELRDSLKQQLPEYMIPSAFVFLDALPLTPNGKLDRKALPEPDQHRHDLGAELIAPRSPLENQLAEIWRDVLKIDRIGIHDNFFELGGHSLLATQVIVRIGEQLSVDISLSSFFESPTIAELAELVENTSVNKSNRGNPITSQPRSSIEAKSATGVEQFEFPTSYSQQGLWLVDKLAGTSENYIIASAFRLDGKLNVGSLELALNAIIDRHEALRTCFSEQDGIPLQVIHSSLSLPFTMMDLRGYSEQLRTSEIARLIKHNATTIFDLKRLPLLRFQLLQIGEEEYIFLYAFHHIITDGWSMAVFARELSELYGVFSQRLASPFSALQFHYADYAVWQREWAQSERSKQVITYWKTRLSDAPMLELATDRQRPVIQSYRGQRHSFSLSPDFTEGLKALSRREGVTLFMTLVSAFQVLLHRYSGQNDILIGTPIAGRSNLGLENLIGYFVNTLVLRTDLSGDPSFRELLAQVRVVALDAYANQDMPFEKLVEVLNPQRDPSHHPLFQVMFVFQNTSEDKLQLNEISVESIKISSATTKFDLTLELSETLEGLTGSLEYATDLFESPTIARLIGHFQTLLNSIMLNPEWSVSKLPLLTESERQQLLVEWNNTYSDYPKDRCIHQLFEEQAGRTPEAIALVFEDQQLSYQALNAKANQLAHYLISLGVGPEVLVAICLERSLDMVVGLLAILKAGGAYVPLDPKYPKERLVFMLEDSAPLVLLSQSRLKNMFSGLTKAIPIIDMESKLLPLPWANQPDINPDFHQLGHTSMNLAYVIYTSGSTGKPKGVQITHRSLFNFLMSMKQLLHITEQDILLAVTTLSFDIAGLEIYLPLICGAKIVIASHQLAMNGSGLATALDKSSAITFMQATPATWRLLLAAEWEGNSRLTVLCGGEALANDLAIQLQKKSKDVVNVYGPTETTVWSTAYRLPNEINVDKTIPIGRPIANTQLYIVDKNLQLVPVGITGELYIGGEGLARGYLNQIELTAKKFIKHPFSEDPHERLYKTGDLARYLSDGTIECLGRIDNQIKLRGFRIELGDIEATLSQYPQLRAVAVNIYQPTPENKRLVAYVVPERDFMPSSSELRDFLKPKLPDYMLPSVYVFLDALPLTPNGKLDRKALPEPDQKRQDIATKFIAPRTLLEKKLAKIWREVLKIDDIGIHDNFFELGGHSLLAVKIIIDVNEMFDTNLPLGLIYQSPTIESFGVMLLSGEKKSSCYSLISIQNQGSRPPLFAIHTITFITDFSQYLGKDQPLYFLRYGMALENSNSPVSLPQLKELARHYIEEMQLVQPQGPYQLIGFSFGGVVAYEMARQLQANGHQLNLVAMLDTYLTNNQSKLLPYDRIVKNIFGLSFKQLLVMVKNKVNYWRLKKDKYCSDFWPHIYTTGPDLICRNGYNPELYEGKVILFQATDRDTFFFEKTPPDLEWRKLLGDRLEVQNICGTHHGIIKDSNAKTLAEKLIACINESIVNS